MSRTTAPKTPLAVVLLTLFLDLVGFSIVFPMFAEMLAYYGATPGGLLGELNAVLERVFDIDDPHRHAAFFGGVLSGVYSVVQFVVTPWWGRLSDRIGRRPVLLATIGINLAGYAVWIFSGSFELFVLSRVLGAFASGNISVASAAVADLSDTAGRAKAMGLMGAAIGLGFITGPALGAAWVLMPTPEVVGASGWALNPFSFPATIAAGLTLINLVWVWRRLGETLAPELRGTGSTSRSANPLRFFAAELGGRVRTLNLAYLLFMVGFAGFEATLVFLAAERLEWGPAQVGGCMIWLGLCSALVQGGIVRRMVGRTGERPLALAGLVLLLPGYALTGLVGLQDQAWLLWVGVTFLALGVGFLSPTLAALVSLTADARSQGRAMGAYRSVGALGRALGPFSAALLYFSFGPAAPYFAGAALCLVPVLLIARLPD